MSNWKKLLDNEWQEYVKYGAEGRFSHSGHEMARWFGDIISVYEGKILDIGCGVITRPEYMHEKAEWYGIDPLGADIKRDFHFTLGKAEQLPYEDEYFDMVVYATSLNHLENPSVSVSEAYRVLKAGGRVALWGGFVDNKRYKEWKKKGGLMDRKHLWGFTRESIINTFKHFEIEKWEVNGKNHAIIFKKIQK